MGTGRGMASTNSCNPFNCTLVIVPVFQEARSEVQKFRRGFGEVREVYQSCLSKMIFRLEKEDYVTCHVLYTTK